MVFVVVARREGVLLRCCKWYLMVTLYVMSTTSYTPLWPQACHNTTTGIIENLVPLYSQTQKIQLGGVGFEQVLWLNAAVDIVLSSVLK